MYAGNQERELLEPELWNREQLVTCKENYLIRGVRKNGTQFGRCDNQNSEYSILEIRIDCDERRY